MITINLYPEGTYFRPGAANSKYQTIQCEKLDSGKTIHEGGAHRQQNVQDHNPCPNSINLIPLPCSKRSICLKRTNPINF